MLENWRGHPQILFMLTRKLSQIWGEPYAETQAAEELSEYEGHE